MSNKRDRNESSQNSQVRSNIPSENLNQPPSVVARQRVVRQSFVGPLPPPETLQSYESLQPGLAARIVALAETEADHRREIEKKQQETHHIVMTSFMEERKRGQYFGLAIGTVGLLCGTLTALYGHATAGAIIGSTSVVSLVSVFVLGRILPKKEGPEQ